MNLLWASLAQRWLLFVVLGLCGTLFFAGEAAASDGTILQANFLLDLVANRSRLIQVSLVMVVLGCSMLWWRGK